MIKKLKAVKSTILGACLLLAFWAIVGKYSGSEIAETFARKAKLQTASEAIDRGLVGIWAYNTETKILTWSPAMFAIYGAEKGDSDPSALKYSFWLDRVMPAQRARINLMLEEHKRLTPPIFNTKFTIVTDAGELRTIESRGGWDQDRLIISGVNLLSNDEPTLAEYEPSPRLSRGIHEAQCALQSLKE